MKLIRGAAAGQLAYLQTGSLLGSPEELAEDAANLLERPECSFSPNSLVLMADGTTKPIKAVAVGDKVKATDPTTGKTVAEPVTQLHDNLDTDMADLTITGGHGTHNIIHTTQNHLI